MFGLGWSEMVLVGIVALIVIGPKDLPGMFRTLGQFTGKAKRMAREFSRAMETAADEAGVNDISSSLKAATNPAKYGVDKIREATGMSYKPGSATAKLSEERAASKAKLDTAMAKAATDRKAKEADKVEAPAAEPKPKAKRKAASKPAKKTAAKQKTPVKPRAARKTKPKGDA